MNKQIFITLVFLLFAIVCNPRKSFAQTTPVVINARTFMLSNEAPGYLIDNLIAAGYGDSSLYAVMQYLQPLSGGAIPQWFMDSLAVCPANSDVFTAELWNFSDPSNNPIGIGEDGSFTIAPIYGRDLSGKEGYTTYNDTLVPVSLKLFTEAIGPEFYIDAGTQTTQPPSGLVTTYYKVFAIAWSMGSTFILSNEGGLIDDLIRTGNGNKNLYQTLEILKPKSGGVISDEFMATLANCPAGSDIFTAALSNFSNAANNPIAINTDGTMHVVSIYGKDYFQSNEFKTLPENQNGYTSEFFTYATKPKNYIDVGSGSSNPPRYYKAFAIVWKASTTFVLSNEGGLIDDLIRAGHGTKDLYQTLEVLKPKSDGVISDEFMTTLANCPAGSEIFTLELNNFSVNWPVAINTDGRVFVTPIYGKDYFRKDGYTTLPLNQNGYTSELYTVANSAENYIDAGQAAEGSPTIYYKAFAIGWSEPATITVNPAVLNIGGSNGSTATFTITSNDGWTITPGRGWLAAIPVSGTGNATVTLTAQANPQTTERTDTLKISATGGEPQIVVVTQSINTGVNTLNEKEFEIYPNPTTGKFRVQSSQFRVETVEVVDLNGKVLENFELLPETGNPEFDIGHLKPGVYFIRLCNHNQTVIGKIVKR